MIRFDNKTKKNVLIVLFLLFFILSLFFATTNLINQRLSRTYYLAGVEAERTGNFSKSITNYKKSIDLDPFFKESYERIIELDFVHNYPDYTQASHYLKEYNQRFPEEEIGHSLQALIFLRDGDTKQAKESLDRIEIVEDTSYLGITYLAMGELNYMEKNDNSWRELFNKSIIFEYETQKNSFYYINSLNFNIDMLSRFLRRNNEYNESNIILDSLLLNSSIYGIENLIPTEINKIKELKKLNLIDIQVVNVQEINNNENLIESNITGTKKILINLTEDYITEFGIENGKALGCAYQALGSLYYKTSKYDNATQSYKNFADLFPDKAKPNFDAAVICFISNDYECSEEYIKNAINIDDKKEYRELLGFSLIMQKKIEDAKEIFENSKNNESVLSRAGIAHIHLMKKEYQNAKVIFEQINDESIEKIGDDLFSNSSYLYSLVPMGLGWTYANQKEHTKAILYFDMVLQKQPNHFLALISKGNSLNWLGRYDEAIEIFNKVIELDSNNEFAYAELGLVYYNIGDDDLSKEYFNKALSLNNETYTCPYEGLGLIYYRQGELQKAKTNLEKSIELNPDIEFLKYNALAKIYIEKNDNQKAFILLEKSIQNFPHESNEAYELIKQI